MTAASTQKALEDYVRTIALGLRLEHWRLAVRISDAPGLDDGNSATINPTDGRKVADLEIAPDVLGDPADLRQTILHELLHLWFRDAVDVVRLGLPKLLGPDAVAALWESYRQQTELLADGLADALADRFPEAPKLGEEKKR